MATKVSCRDHDVRYFDPIRTSAPGYQGRPCTRRQESPTTAVLHRHLSSSWAFVASDLVTEGAATGTRLDPEVPSPRGATGAVLTKRQRAIAGASIETHEGPVPTLALGLNDDQPPPVGDCLSGPPGRRKGFGQLTQHRSAGLFDLSTTVGGPVRMGPLGEKRPGEGALSGL